MSTMFIKIFLLLYTEEITMPSSLAYLREEVESKRYEKNQSDGRIMDLDRLFSSVRGS